MPLFFCDTYPRITIYCPTVNYDAKFRFGKFNTDEVPEEIRDEVIKQLSSATECYEDDGTLPCGHAGCGFRTGSQRGLEAHWRNEHGGNPPGVVPTQRVAENAPVAAKRGARNATWE